MLLRRNFYSKLILIFVFILVLVFLFGKTTSNSKNRVNLDANEVHNEPLAATHVNDVENSIYVSKDYNLKRWIERDLMKQEPGLGDEGHIAYLDGTAKEIGEKQLAKIALNEELSEHISYNRSVPDARNPACRKKKYDMDSLAALPTSVIIIFFNEPYSVLVRTVHSVLNTVTDGRLLKEIILVDDASTNTELKDKLDYYINKMLPKKVKMLRLKNRLGLIRARLAGARMAKGEVLVFLDAHCECVRQWLEPLLERIHESRTSVLVPIIDVIEAKNFLYSTNGVEHFQVGGFTWDGHFDWHDVPESERKRQRRDCKEKNLDICPTYSPTMAGGLFAIERNYFWEIGSYDEQMDGWGGENLEMSFRIWQCGGTLETIPCSRIGHIFRDFHPYSFPNDRDTHGINTVRMAKVWMDDYINLFFLNRPDLKNHPDIGDVTHRKMLRDKLHCKSFDWYMQNIYPEKFIPTKNVKSYGRVEALSKNICLDDMQQNLDEPYNLGGYMCYKLEVTSSQLFSLTKNNVLRTERNCATVQDVSSDIRYVVMMPCNSDQDIEDRWDFTGANQFRHRGTRLCMDHRYLETKKYIYVAKCDPNSLSQAWRFAH